MSVTLVLHEVSLTSFCDYQQSVTKGIEICSFVDLVLPKQCLGQGRKTVRKTTTAEGHGASEMVLDVKNGLDGAIRHETNHNTFDLNGRFNPSQIPDIAFIRFIGDDGGFNENGATGVLGTKKVLDSWRGVHRDHHETTTSVGLGPGLQL